MTLQSTLSLAKQNLQNTLATAESFWAFCGIDDDYVADDLDPNPTPEEILVVKIAAAAERIYLDGLPRPKDAENNPTDNYTKEEFATYHPCVVIFTAEENGLTINVDGGENQASGSLKARFYAIIAEEYNMFGGEPTAEAKSAFEDSVGLIMNELHDMSLLQLGYLSCRRIALSWLKWGDPRQTPIDGCRMGAELLIDWSGM